MYLNNLENIERIFNIEKIIMDYGINHDNIIKTDFINNKDDYKKCTPCCNNTEKVCNLKLYNKCIKLLKINTLNNNISDFINLDYIFGNYFNQKIKQKKREPKFKEYARADIIKYIIDF